MNPKVTVVVPVYNPGDCIDACIDSLLRQTLPASEFEVLFVDDGSTDDTPARLDALAAEHPHFKAIHIPNSGWPGKPRNVGVAEARGEYVQFLDEDDHLAADALRRLYELGSRRGADVVLGKVASNFRGVPHGVFREDRESCTIADAPLYDSLTPHKMFRTAFLRENGIAYPEGKCYLEDQPYMMSAYLQARRVAILGSYTAYFYWQRADGRHAGATKIVPSEYVDSVRAVLDVVLAHTEPGEARDRMLRRFYRVEMLGCLAGAGVYKYDPESFDELFALMRGLDEEYMNDAVRSGLGAVLRPRSATLLAGDAEGFRRAAAMGSAVKAAARLEAADWEPDGRLKVDVTVHLVHGEDRARLELVHRDGRYFLPASPAGATDEPVDVTDELADIAADLTIRGRSNSIEWHCPAAFTASVEPVGEGRAEVVLRGTGHAVTEADGARDRLSKGLWDLWVPVRVFGQMVKARLGADRADGVAEACRPAVLGAPARGVAPYFTEHHGNLSLDVGARSRTLAKALADRPVALAAADPAELRLDVFTTADAKALKPVVVLTGPAGSAEVPAGWRRVAGRVHLRLPKHIRDVEPGVHALGVRLDGPTGRELPLGKAEVGRGGTLAVEAGFRAADPRVRNEVASQRRSERRHRAASLPKRALRRLVRKVRR
ncbi:glycosyltransferase family 2 protein [Glycomyces arizonensis]|uniref:glycosyltransferase family 2 protein n=1 Tax=Glycomyces arizonensis TaxID=256035 RepID=UPI00042206CF|nr:glycosyltransferase family 2 protein [Glycomyces arizonensis]